METVGSSQKSDNIHAELAAVNRKNIFFIEIPFKKFFSSIQFETLKRKISLLPLNPFFARYPIESI